MNCLPLPRWFFLLIVFLVLVTGCSPRPSSAAVYYWKTTLDWSDQDSLNLREAGVGRVGLRLMDWDGRPVAPLAVARGFPSDLEVEPVVYVTLQALRSPAVEGEADALLAAADAVLARVGGRPSGRWQFDGDWTAATRGRWFTLVGALAERLHARGQQLWVTLRLHQVRDRAAQGVPPADGAVLMTYGAGDRVLDPALVEAYLKGERYPLPLEAAYPVFSQVQVLNGYGRVLGYQRLGAQQPWPSADLEETADGHFTVLRRTELGGRPLMAHDALVVDRVRPEDLARVRLLAGAWVITDRPWVFDYDGQEWEVVHEGTLAPWLFPR